MGTPGASTNPFAPSTNPFSGDPFGNTSPVQTTYQPPATGAWGAAPAAAHAAQEDDDIEPFTVAHLSTPDAVVPAIPVSSGGGAPPPKSASHTGLAFTEPSSQPAGDFSGKIGPAPSPVPRVGSAPDTTLLLPGGVPRSASPGPAVGGSGVPGEPEDPSKYAFYNIKRYRTYFNVDTTEVLQRIFWSVVLFFKSDFLDNISDNPDLYGPFWVATTLIFVSAVTGNYASYLDFKHHHPPGEEEITKGWYYDVAKVGGSAGLFYGYVGAAGLVVWLVLRWFKAGVSLASVWCTYGYALAVFIPISFACIFPLEMLRVGLVAGATAVSGIFILLNFRRPVFDHVGAKALPVYVVMAGAHAVLGLALYLFFFKYSDIQA